MSDEGIISLFAQFLAMFDELADAFQDILLAGHSGVILSVAQACKKLSAKQGSFVQVSI